MTGSMEARPTKEQLLIINGAGCQVINTARNAPHGYPAFVRTEM